MANRIRIFNWRHHGDDESYCRIECFPDGVEDDMDALVRKEHDIEPDPERDAEQRGDFESVIYVNDDFTFEDGEILEAPDGRTFRLSLTEVRELIAPIGKRFVTLVPDMEEDDEHGEVKHPVGSTFIVMNQVNEGSVPAEFNVAWDYAEKDGVSVPADGMWTIWTADELATEAVEVRSGG